MATGVVPVCLKVFPTHKAKDKVLFSNYRPISLLPIISKMLEKKFHKRVSNLINDRFAKSQYGFRSKHSFITNSLIPLITRPTRVTDHTANLIDNIYTTLETDEHVYSGIILTKFLSDHYPVFSFIGETPKSRLNL
jgi:hypothetical protein